MVLSQERHQSPTRTGAATSEVRCSVHRNCDHLTKLVRSLTCSKDELRTNKWAEKAMSMGHRSIICMLKAARYNVLDGVV